MLIWVCSHFSALKYARLNIGKGEGAHLSENKGVKSECKKFGKNSREMAPVSTICDEYSSFFQEGCLASTRLQKSVIRQTFCSSRH